MRKDNEIGLNKFFFVGFMFRNVISFTISYIQKTCLNKETIANIIIITNLERS